ncbi:hypothetical protein [Anaerocolumna sp. MB42-C2]|uniref:hypothetical protein n=1 Tax=Anaerocolumna sp. MB42-C2 TaxID=3070997 RepID=UPI0027DF2263|nr:hypothetical protein [Anaerocolumna sp. MB42-C2]WMJ86366.1 hypothetical protein RBU59_20310 [Anaerocolumna sp. MB42-C2]
MRKKANKVEERIYYYVYIIMNLFQTYIIFRFMGVFFDREKINKYRERLAYMGYYLCITTVYLLITVPVITLICNLMALTLLSFNYRTDIKKRVLSVSLIYLVLLCTESISLLLTGYMEYSIFTQNNYVSVYGTVCTQVLTYMTVLVLENFKNIKRGALFPQLTGWPYS